jgi:hypothetical protein
MEMREFLTTPLVAVVASVAATASFWVALWWVNRRDRRRWELHEQLREMEQAIREEAMSNEQRGRWRQYRAQEAAITQEARRRLALPDEGPPTC